MAVVYFVPNQTKEVLPSSLTNLVASHSTLKSSALQVRSEQLVLLPAQTQNIQMKNPCCRRIVHPGINLVVSFTEHQHLTMHKICHNEGLPPLRKRSRRSHEVVNCNLCIFCGDETNGATILSRRLH